MALIQCPECGKEVSDKAIACPNCAYPISEMQAGGMVKIRIPRAEKMITAFLELFSSRGTSICSIMSMGKMLWSGHLGQTAIFTIEKPTEVTINMGRWVEPLTGIVKANHKYGLIRDYSSYISERFQLSEVDVIDSDP